MKCALTIVATVLSVLVAHPLQGGASHNLGHVTYVASDARGATDELDVVFDPATPEVKITSPTEGSVVAGSTVTVTGTVTDGTDSVGGDRGSSPVFGEASFRVFSFGGTTSTTVKIGEGVVPVVDGRFTIPEVLLGRGQHLIGVTVPEAGFDSGVDGVQVTSDPEAPPVTLVRPRDGEALLTATTTVDLNFSAPTTLVSVNGTPDGRLFPAGLAVNALTLPLALGPNPFVLKIATGSGSFTFSFTLFRVASLEPPRIRAPANGSVTNQTRAIVSGTVPLGTPFVQVNGLQAAIADDLVSFTAEVPLPKEGFNEVRCVAFPSGLTDRVFVKRDTLPPRLLGLLPKNFSITRDASVVLAGAVSEPADVEAIGPGGSVAGVARFFAGVSAPSFGFFGDVIGFQLPALSLVEGVNLIDLRLSDTAGNEAEQTLTLTRLEPALGLVEPAAGSAVPALRTDITLEARVGVAFDAVFSAGRRIPEFEGRTLSGGTLATLEAVPLVPGETEIRIVYHREGRAPEVLSFTLQSTATDVATVTGTVTDAQTGEAIENGLVSVTVNGLTFILATDPDGSFETQVEPGDVTIVAASNGFAAASFSTPAGSGQIVTADLSLEPTGLPSVMNEVAILVPPDGTVTDFEKVTVVGTVLNPVSAVVVNGIRVEVVGNRFTARSVPLALGANTIDVAASVPGLPTATDSVSVERADEPVLAVKIFSPPAGASVPGGGLVVRGFVSAKDALTAVIGEGGGFADVEQGVFEFHALFPLPDPDSPIEVRVRTSDPDQTATDTVRVDVARITPALLLTADPSSGDIPLATTLRASLGVPFDPIRLDFDVDGDGILDVHASPSAEVATTLTDPHPHLARALATTAQGVELSAPARVDAHLPAVVLAEFAHGNPVDLARGPDGDLYVLDGAAGTVSQYSAANVLKSVIGSSGAGRGQLLSPQALAVGLDGLIYVADTGNNRVQVFDSSGSVVRQIGAGLLSSPRGVAVTGESVVVSDTGNGRLQLFGSDGNPRAFFEFTNPRGIAPLRIFGTAVASPQEGIATLRGAGLVSAQSLLSSKGRPAAPVDIASGDDRVLIADASTGDVFVFTTRLGFRRTVGLQGLAPLAVLPSLRQDTEAVLIADGLRVTEVGMPVPSALPVVESLKTRLAAGDVAGALTLIHPARRPFFAELYALIEAELPSHAAQMDAFLVERVREGAAVVVIETESIVGGTPIVEDYPVQLIRGEDGQWLIVDY